MHWEIAERWTHQPIGEATMAALRDGYGLFQGFRTTRTKQPSQRQPRFIMFCFRGSNPLRSGRSPRCRLCSANRTGNCSRAPGARQEQVPSACARVRREGWAPPSSKSLHVVRRTTHPRTHRLPMVCAHFGLANYIPVPRSARSTAGSALWSTGRIRNTTRLAATCANLMLAPVPQVEPSARKSDARRGS